MNMPINSSSMFVYPSSLVLVTLRISGVNELGPLEENAATLGPYFNLKIVFAGKIFVLASL